MEEGRAGRGPRGFWWDDEESGTSSSARSAHFHLKGRFGGSEDLF